MKTNYSGLIAAAFTPMKPDGSINIEQVKPITDYLVADGIKGLYVCGSTGEGPLITTEERKNIAAAYVKAAQKRIPVIIQVGHNSIQEACELARHAQAINADAIAAIPPSYFNIDSIDTLMDCFEKITSAAPDVPFFYYNIPQLTGTNFDMVDFLRLGLKRLPTLAGIKYSALSVYEFQECIEFADGRFNILFGCDEMLLSGLAAGAPGAVGSTFNFAAPVYHHVIKSFKSGDMESARRYQSLSVNMVRLLLRYRGQPAFKAFMSLLGFDCGPNRLPLKTLTTDKVLNMKKDLEKMDLLKTINKLREELKMSRPIKEVAAKRGSEHQAVHDKSA